MRDRDQTKSAIVSEIETICFALDEILDNINLVNTRNADNISERLALSRIQAARALGFLIEDKEKE